MADGIPTVSAVGPPEAAHEERLLLAEVAAGNSAAWGRFVTAHRQRVVSLAYRLLAWPEEVDDVVQEVFLSALAGARTFRGDCAVSTWLTTITLNECRRRWRRRLLRRARLAERAEPKSRREAPPSDTAALQRERFQEVRSALRRLRPRDREMIVLRHLEDMSIARISDVLGLGRSAVEARLSRARARLRKLLGEAAAE